MLMSAVFAQSDCNESNWQEYDGKDMSYCQLQKANLTYANLGGANLYGANLEGAYLFAVDLWDANLCNLVKSPSGDVCEESVTDSNGDGYDDVSYEVGYEAGATSGDLNLDGSGDVLDVVMLVNNIINP